MIHIRNKRIWKGEGEYLGRPSPLGNPYQIGRDGTRLEVMEKFERWLDRILKEPPNHLSWNEQLAQTMFFDLLVKAEKDDLNLICWCAPAPCHLDIVKKKLESLMEKRRHGHSGDI